MSLFINEILQLQSTEFLSSQFGIVIQIAAIIAILFSGAKYMNKKFDERINHNIQEKLQPVVKEICKQISDVSQAIKDYQAVRNTSQQVFEAKTDTAIKYIDRALMNLQGIKEEKETKDRGGYC